MKYNYLIDRTLFIGGLYLMDTINSDSIYIENEYGEKLNPEDFYIKASEEEPTKITIAIINNKEYEKNKVYYVVVENTLVSTEENETLEEAVKLPFIIIE